MKRALWVFVAAVGVGAGLSACGLEEEQSPEATWYSEQEIDVCKGENTLPGGGKFVSENKWDDVGAADQPGYTGIDTKKPEDRGLIEAEKKASEAMKGNGCIYGAHGRDPDKCEGKSTVQSLPHDTSKSVFHAKEHAECVGKPMWLSVCFAGKAGKEPYVSIASAVNQNYNVPADKIVACTGLVGPGNPMKCYGTLVDGNGKPIGDQQVGELKFIQVRGDPPAGELIRCNPNATCPTCKPDGGTDGGCTGTTCPVDAGSDAGTSDAGTSDAGTSDAGSPDEDAGSPDEDAGSSFDAGSPGEDAGSPDEDAGSPDEDAGSPDEDAGSPDEDAGSSFDAGSPEEDAGSPDEDAGIPEEDAGYDAGIPEEDAGYDAGVPEEDAGSPEEDAGYDAGIPDEEDAGSDLDAGAEARRRPAAR